MYLTNQQLITQRTDSGGSLEQFCAYVQTVYTLVKKYGSSSVKGDLLKHIQEVDSDLADVVTLLDTVGKIDLKRLGSLLGVLGGGESEGYTVKSSHADLVESKISPDAQKIQGTTLGVQISGDGKIYKRGLDRDLDKMLG